MARIIADYMMRFEFESWNSKIYNNIMVCRQISFTEIIYSKIDVCMPPFSVTTFFFWKICDRKIIDASEYSYLLWYDFPTPFINIDKNCIVICIF
jgi:hypothetical protein